MAKFIELEDGHWLNADKIELLFTGVSTWRKENKSKINDIAKWIATLSDNSAQTTVAASGDMFTDLFHAMDAIVNNIQAEGAKE